MDPRLERLANEAEERGRRDVRRVLELIAEKGYPAKLADSIPEVQRLLPGCLKLAGELKRRFPLAMAAQLSADRDGKKRLAGELITKLWGDLNRATNLSTLATNMSGRIENIRAMKPADVKKWVLETVARGQIELCDSLMEGLKFLRTFSSDVDGKVSEINRQLDLCADTPAHPAESAPALGQPDPNEGPVLTDFDARRS